MMGLAKKLGEFLFSVTFDFPELHPKASIIIYDHLIEK